MRWLDSSASFEPPERENSVFASTGITDDGAGDHPRSRATIDWPPSSGVRRRSSGASPSTAGSTMRPAFRVWLRMLEDSASSPSISPATAGRSTGRRGPQPLLRRLGAGDHRSRGCPRVSKSFALVGHSMGAGISSLVPAAVPGGWLGLVLLEGAGPLTTPPEDAPTLLRRALEDERRVAAIVGQDPSRSGKRGGSAVSRNRSRSGVGPCAGRAFGRNRRWTAFGSPSTRG